MSELDELKQQMAELVRDRESIVRDARVAIHKEEGRIEQVNREFDKLAIPLARKIAKLEESVKPNVSAARNIELTGLTVEEQEHFERLRAAQKAR